MSPQPHSVLFQAASTQQQAAHGMFAAVQAHQEQQTIELMQWHTAMRSRQHLALFNITHLEAVLLTPAFKSLLGVQSSVNLALFASSGQHARVSHTKDAPEILLTLPKALADLLYVGRHLENEGVFQLVFRHTDAAWIFLAVKFISVGTRANADECWVRTAYKINRKRLLGLKLRHHLTEVLPTHARASNMCVAANDPFRV
jgi:hypothetical protein